MLELSSAAALSSASTVSTALASRLARHCFSFAICSSSTDSGTVTIPPASPASGEGSLSVHLLTPTTVISPDSMDPSRAVFAFTSADFM